MRLNFHLGDVIKSAKELVEHDDQLFWWAGTRQLCEPHNICIQDAAHTQTDTNISHIFTWQLFVSISFTLSSRVWEKWREEVIEGETWGKDTARWKKISVSKIWHDICTYNSRTCLRIIPFLIFLQYQINPVIAVCTSMGTHCKH